MSDSASTNPSTTGFFSAFIAGRKGEILDAALTVFGEKGYDGGTMREIAAIVGVSEPALYRHYAGKEALLVDLVELASTRLLSTAVARFDEARPLGVRRALVSLVEDRRDLVSSNFELLRTLMMATHHNARAREAFRVRLLEPVATSVSAIITDVDRSQGKRRSPGEVDAKVRVVMSLLVGHVLTSQFFGAADNDEDVVATLLTVLGWDHAE